MMKKSSAQYAFCAEDCYFENHKRFLLATNHCYTACYKGNDFMCIFFFAAEVCAKILPKCLYDFIEEKTHQLLSSDNMRCVEVEKSYSEFCFINQNII